MCYSGLFTIKTMSPWFDAYGDEGIFFFLPQVHIRHFGGRRISFKFNMTVSLTLREVQLALSISQMDTGLGLVAL